MKKNESPFRELAEYAASKDGEKIEFRELTSADLESLIKLYVQLDENVVTDKDYRKQGLAKKVIEMAENFARENNCYKVILQSNVKRTEAHKFYEGLGFRSDTKKAFDLRLKKPN